jgi:hypothetical protein
MTPEMGSAIAQHVDLVQTALAPWDTGRTYMNFVERQVDSGNLFPEAPYRRLRNVKSRYDPDDIFQSNHPIHPE